MMARLPRSTYACLAFALAIVLPMVDNAVLAQIPNVPLPVPKAGAAGNRPPEPAKSIAEDLLRATPKAAVAVPPGARHGHWTAGLAVLGIVASCFGFKGLRRPIRNWVLPRRRRQRRHRLAG
jgi:hypothetical protein